MQLRRISTALQLVFLAFFRGEVLVEEAEQAMDNTLLVLDILGTRWRAASFGYFLQAARHGFW
jgi:hypothetical protein